MSDRRAQLFAIDLLLALVPLTIMLGMSANAISGAALQVQDYANLYSLNRRTDDAIDVLVKTPGIPVDWNDTNRPSMVGFAHYDNETDNLYPYKLSPTKISWVNDADIRNLTGTDNFYLNFTMMIPENYSSITYSWGSQVPENASDVVVAERYVNYFLSEIWGVIMDVIGQSSQSSSTCNPSFGGGNPSRSCQDDSVSLDDTFGDFWIYIRTDANANGEIYFNDILLVDNNDMPACTKNWAKFCENDEWCNPGTVDMRISFILDSGEEFLPGPGNSLQSSGHSCTGGSADVSKTVLRIPVDSLVGLENFMNITVAGQLGQNNTIDTYAIRAPPGIPWQLVDPDLEDIDLFGKLKLMMWLE